MLSFMRRRDESRSSTPLAPRMQTLPLPEVGSVASSPVLSPKAIPKTPKQSQADPMPSKLPKGTRSRRSPSEMESGYSTSPEGSGSSSRRPRAPSDARSPLPAPLKGILKQRTDSTPIVVRTALIHQDRDGYSSSPENIKATAARFRSSQARGQSSRPRASTSAMTPRTLTPPATLHWKLLPFNAQISKGRLIFDVSQRAEHIRLAATSPRPLTTIERNKPASEPPLTEMVIRCADLPDWPIVVTNPTGVRCIDVFERIEETFSVCLTQSDRRTHEARMGGCREAYEARLRRAPVSPAEAAKGPRRHDLLASKTMFMGLDWVPPDEKNPNGSWALKLGSAFF
ncbi:hypothetical protein BV25DRAFT_1918405 [Artomyces pyxidatus]|uniref:Uncharacterized protein n=1 Tax=Artomyces pyxidatus TaxID=48021 RepID=A0ACB8SUK2_9AGAM|nr:hypothetical protein BV25DRAFT_1918405 [Artomyces pyxidatus]